MIHINFSQNLINLTQKSKANYYFQREVEGKY